MQMTKGCVGTLGPGISAEVLITHGSPKHNVKRVSDWNIIKSEKSNFLTLK